MYHRGSLLTLALALLGCVQPLRSEQGKGFSRPPLPAGNEADWPMFRDDLERSGFAEGSSVGSEVSAVWQIPSFNRTQYGAVKGSPSVVGDVVYCGTDTGRFVAARMEDGARCRERAPALERPCRSAHPELSGGQRRWASRRVRGQRRSVIRGSCRYRSEALGYLYWRPGEWIADAGR
jgi:hypothetical protein